MVELFNVVMNVMNSQVIQGTLAAVNIVQIIVEVLEGWKDNHDTLESQAIYCFDRALHKFCAYYGKQYNRKEIADMLSTYTTDMQKLHMHSYQDAVLKKALGSEDISNDNMSTWYYYIDKTIAEEKLDILNSFLNLRRSRQTGEKIPRMLTEKAPMPPVEEELLSRTQEQKDILEIIQKKKKLVLVNGLGGVGKSTVCKELFYYLYEKSVRQLAWVTYNGVSLEEDFITQFFYPKLMSKRRQYISYFLQNEIDEDAIVFVDNLNVRDVDERFIETLKRAKCNVVCTSRVTDFQYFATIPIDFFQEKQCVCLFKKYAHINSDEDDVLIEQIVRKVALHTLTIEILGKIAYCEGQSPKQILDNLELDGINLEGVVQVHLHEDTLVGHLCKIFPVSKLDKERKYILAHFAHCPLEQIPKEMKNWLGISNKYNINYLKKYGWFVENEQSYYMHPIIKEVVKKICLLEHVDYSELLKSLEALTRYDRNIGVAKALPYYPYVKSVLKHVDDMVTPSIAWLYFNCAWIEKCLKNYEMAIKHFEGALKQWMAPAMEEYHDIVYINTRIVNIYVQIGACYNEKGMTDEARKWYDRMRYFDGKYSDNELRAQIHNNYALTYQEDFRRFKGKQGLHPSTNRDYYKAKNGFEKTILGFQRLGKKDEFMALAFRNMGMLYMEGGENEKAIIYLQRALQIREKVLEDSSPDKEKNYYELAKAYMVLSEKVESPISRLVKCKIAYHYFKSCYAVCEPKARRNTNVVDLERLEIEMEKCREGLQNKLE